MDRQRAAKGEGIARKVCWEAEEVQGERSEVASVETTGCGGTMDRLRVENRRSTAGGNDGQRRNFERRALRPRRVWDQLTGKQLCLC